MESDKKDFWKDVDFWFLTILFITVILAIGVFVVVLTSEGCSRFSRNKSFKYQDRVVVTEGFYSGNYGGIMEPDTMIVRIPTEGFLVGISGYNICRVPSYKVRLLETKDIVELQEEQLERANNAKGVTKKGQ